ncbi:hypothetical protein BDV39DRAFT_167988, partial [Aspergillus sergii]
MARITVLLWGWIVHLWTGITVWWLLLWLLLLGRRRVTFEMFLFSIFECMMRSGNYKAFSEDSHGDSGRNGLLREESIVLRENMIRKFV